MEYGALSRTWICTQLLALPSAPSLCPQGCFDMQQDKAAAHMGFGKTWFKEVRQMEGRNVLRAKQRCAWVCPFTDPRTCLSDRAERIRAAC